MMMADGLCQAPQLAGVLQKGIALLRMVEDCLFLIPVNDEVLFRPVCRCPDIVEHGSEMELLQLSSCQAGLASQMPGNGRCPAVMLAQA